MDVQKKVLNRIFGVWLSMAAPIVYIGICEFILRAGAHGTAFKGYAPLAFPVYNAVKTTAYLLSALMAAMIVNIKISINEGRVSGLSAIFLKKIEISGDDVSETVAQSLIVLIAICNSAAVYGITLFFLNGIRGDSYPLMIVAFLLMMLFLPTKELIDKMAALKKN